MDEMDRIAQAIEGWRVVPGFPAGRFAYVGAEEDGPIEEGRDSRSGLSYFVRYEGGSISERRITIRSLQMEGGAILRLTGFCHERRQVRTFRIDRIAEVVDIDSGEVLSAGELCRALLDRGVPVAEQRLVAMMKILVFMARCDGHAHHLEWEEIDRTLIRLSRCLINDDRGVEDLMADARRLAPDDLDFLRALRGLTKTRLPARMHAELRRGVAAVIEADGIQAAEEVRWALETEDFIARMPTSG